MTHEKHNIHGLDRSGFKAGMLLSGCIMALLAGDT